MLFKAHITSISCRHVVQCTERIKNKKYTEVIGQRTATLKMCTRDASGIMNPKLKTVNS
jgi:hypothetical protein